MKDLRSHIRQIQKLENSAAEKIAMRFMLLDERKLLGKDSAITIKNFIEKVQLDIFPEMIASAKLGRELNSEIKG